MSSQLSVLFFLQMLTHQRMVLDSNTCVHGTENQTYYFSLVHLFNTLNRVSYYFCIELPFGQIVYMYNDCHERDSLRVAEVP